MSKRKDRTKKPWDGNRVMVLEAEISRLQAALEDHEAWLAWNGHDKIFARYQRERHERLATSTCK